MKAKQMTHQNYFALCEELRNHREQVMKCKVVDDVMAIIQPKMKVPIGNTTLRSALKTLGINISGKKSMQQAHQGKNLKMIVSALMELYTKLGEVPSDELRQVHKSLTNHQA